MAFTKSRRSSRRFRFVTRSRSSSAPANKKSRFGAMIRRCRKAKTILWCVRRTPFSKKRRSRVVFRLRSKREFHTALVWAEEAVTLLPLCWRSTNCSRQIYFVKRWRNSREILGVSYGAQQFTQQSFVNDLEHPVFEKFVFLAQLKMWLLNQPEVGAALMSGSGSTVFAVIRDNTDVDRLAMRAKAELDSELWTCACETR